MVCTLEDVLAIKVPTGRNASQTLALEELHARFGFAPLRMVETGTIRNPSHDNRMGDGWATLTWLLWAAATGGRVWTVDVDPQAIELCKLMTRNSPRIEYVLCDSVSFLRSFEAPIHLLYLDSFDAGPPGDPRVAAACRHQLAEIEAAYDKLDPDALVILDDVLPDYRNGKGELSVPYLLDRGWRILSHVETQAVLARS